MRPSTPIHEVADVIADRLFALLKAGKMAAIGIDSIRAACEIAAHYEEMGGAEYRLLEERALRKLIGKVG
jgi:hypothetical protein